MSKVVYPAHRYVRAAAEVELPDRVGGEEIAETLYRVDEDVAGNGIDTKAVVQLYRIAVKVEEVCQDFVSHISPRLPPPGRPAAGALSRGRKPRGGPLFARGDEP